MMVTPPLGASLVKVAVADAVLPPFTEAGFTVIDANVAPVIASDALLDMPA